MSTTRRRFIQTTAVSALAVAAGETAEAATAAHQATGTRVGEVTDTTAIVWTRLTKYAERNRKGVPMETRADKAEKPPAVPADEILGACPGMAGRVRVRYGLKENLSDARETEWVEVTEATDFIHQFPLSGLKAGSTYDYRSETAGADGSAHGSYAGRFNTAPATDAVEGFRFCVMTCQGYHDRDHEDGHPIYPAMLALAPKFVTMTGDLVYYDNDAPRATTPRLARLHWERMFSLPRLTAMLRSTSSYWLKDDHDVLQNDSWPGTQAGALTFAQGQEIFRQQAPMGDKSYRTVRWGRDLQVWFTDGRDFRSPNKMPDGPEKTIWGAEQKAWFKQTVKESDATWKLLISPTPLVGPDRSKKNDNHANEGFAHEGGELRGWLKENVPDHFFVVCGDRHWQYHSVHPETGVQEFSVGAASDSHASGSPGLNKRYHRFHRVKGGFLCVDLRREGGESVLTFQLRDVNGGVVYEAPFRRALG